MTKIEREALMAVVCVGDPFGVSMRKMKYSIGLVHHVLLFLDLADS
jgi:hypothetical protein